MEKTYKKFSTWVGMLVNTCISLLKIVLRLGSAGKLPIAAGSSCAILGNGPSLKQSIEKYGNLLKQHELMCVNNFSITEEYVQLKPQYYVMLDPGYWVDNNPHFTVTDTINGLREKTTWPIQLLVPSVAKKSKKLKELCAQNTHVKVCYFNYTVFKGFSGLAHFLFKKNLAAPQCQNVIVASLFLAINCGFKQIYLFGADHTWHQNLHVNEENKLCIKDVHFYDNEEKVKYTFFYNDETETNTFKMHEILATWAKAFYGYEVIKKYAEYRNVSIYNASEISFIDSFERKKLN